MKTESVKSKILTSAVKSFAKLNKSGIDQPVKHVQSLVRSRECQAVDHKAICTHTSVYRQGEFNPEWKSHGESAN